MEQVESIEILTSNIIIDKYISIKEQDYLYLLERLDILEEKSKNNELLIEIERKQNQLLTNIIKYQDKKVDKEDKHQFNNNNNNNNNQINLNSNNNELNNMIKELHEMIESLNLERNELKDRCQRLENDSVKNHHILSLKLHHQQQLITATKIKHRREMVMWESERSILEERINLLHRDNEAIKSELQSSNHLIRKLIIDQNPINQFNQFNHNGNHNHQQQPINNQPQPQPIPIMKHPNHYKHDNNREIKVNFINDTLQLR